MLPEELEFVLELIGVAWPNVNEDELRAMAESYRGYADELESVKGEADAVVAELVGANSGAGVEAFGEYWDRFSGEGFTGLAEAARAVAGALDTAAGAVEFGKTSVIGQLFILAAEVAAATAASPFTLGLSALGGLAATQATRLIVRELLQEMLDQVIAALLGVVSDAVVSAVEATLTEMLTQALENSIGVRDGYDVGAAANAGYQAGADALPGASGTTTSLASAQSAPTPSPIADVMRGQAPAEPAAEAPVPVPTGNRVLDRMRGLNTTGTEVSG
ncbi:WXG100 family type VII secretion target [Allostreptomyces psammosilenae]